MLGVVINILYRDHHAPAGQFSLLQVFSGRVSQHDGKRLTNPSTDLRY